METDKQADIKTLQEENEKLIKRQSIKADLMSVGAHQIRTSLSAIKWIIKMFIDGDLGKLTAEQENLMRKAYEDNDRAIGIVTELLQANKIDDVIEKKYSFSEVNIIELIESSIFDFSGEAFAHKVEIIFLKPEMKLPTINADKDKFPIVLQNLFENAIKYSNQYGKVFIALREKDGFVEVSVKDMGIGISEKGKKNIFEKFYRDTTAKEKESAGSGIGLFTAKKIIEDHGGKIWFESGKGEGTTFFFTIPIYKGSE
ncbi:MAG: HAMP domain-containing sensor histidine kinase [Patescibacteria group bacterium]